MWENVDTNHVTSPDIIATSVRTSKFKQSMKLLYNKWRDWMDLFDGGCFFLVGDGSGYYRPRYAEKGINIGIENPGMSIVERNYLVSVAIDKIRSLGHISRPDFWLPSALIW